MENKILLRKLSKKSIISGLDGGYMENQPVSVLLKSFPKKLAFIYFRFEKISFTDDILEELGIKGKYEIPKPSSDRERQIDYFMDMYRASTDEQRMGHYNRKKKIKKIIDTKKSFMSDKQFSNNMLKIKNQGRYKQP